MQPRLLGKAAGLDRPQNVDRQAAVFQFAQKRGADAGADAAVYADGAHGIEPQKPQRLNVHVRKRGVSAGMRVDAAEAGQPVEVAAQMHLGQADGGNGADSDLQNLAVAIQIDQHFAVQLIGKAHEQLQKPVGKEHRAVKVDVVQLFHFLNQRFANALKVSVYHL